MRVHPSVKENELFIKPLSEDVRAQINGTDLIQSLRNLIVNGLQCSSDKHRVEVRGVVVNAKIPAGRNDTSERFVHGEEFRNVAPLLALSVEDTGPGISAENMKRIFSESFTTKESDKGTGLGLFIVQRLVAGARGAIQVRTKVGRGTTFTIYLPLE